MSLFKGSGVAIVTPFKNGAIDYDALRHLIKWHIASGTDAILPCGTTGEASTLSPIEKAELVEFVVNEVSGRVPVIAGAGTNDTSASIYLAKTFKKIGADGLLVVTPYYNKASSIGLTKHYFNIADSTDLPIILYSVKSRTGVNIDVKTVIELKKHPNIIGIKEASGDIAQICDIATHIDEGFDLYAGNDDQAIPIASLGGIGCISTIANIIPCDFSNMIHEYLSGNVNEATKMQLRMIPLIRAIFREVNPIPVKAALNMMGYIEKEYRMPLCAPTNETLYLLYDEMQNYGIKF